MSADYCGIQLRPTARSQTEYTKMHRMSKH